MPPLHPDPVKAKALRAYVRLGTVLHACRAVGVGRRTWYDWLTHDPDFATAAAEAREEATDHLEREAVRRAVKGSDTLLIFLLKVKRRAEFGDRQLGAAKAIPVQEFETFLHELATAAERAVRSEVHDSKLANSTMERLGREWMALLAARYPDLVPPDDADADAGDDALPPDRRIGSGA